MLESMNLTSVCDLFHEIPAVVKLNRHYNLPEAKSEMEVSKIIRAMASLNEGTDHKVSFLGAGSYDHYIPSIVRHTILRNEFYTAYTPYQPEVAQGTLQYIFEYQTMMTNLTGMDVSNASMYDGATATAEAVSMAIGQTRRSKVLVTKTTSPFTIDVVKTYAHFRDVEVILINDINGLIDVDDLKSKLDKDVACVVVSNPNFLGLIEELDEVSELVRTNKSLFIMNVNPMTLPLMKTPGELNADIAVGDAQVFGIPQSFGGPYLGFLTTTTKLMRKMPGRICGQTTDVDGKRAFVLTLQAREQHIRREKANSNICSNQSLNVLAASVYMATMGEKGLKEVATQNIQKAHYAFKEITNLDQFEKVYETPFFNEFVVKSNVPYAKVKEALAAANIIGGYHLGEVDENLQDHLLFCVTEKRSKAEIDQLVSVLGGIK